jgi:hypothetical protein
MPIVLVRSPVNEYVFIEGRLSPFVEQVRADEDLGAKLDAAVSHLAKPTNLRVGLDSPRLRRANERNPRDTCHWDPMFHTGNPARGTSSSAFSRCPALSLSARALVGALRFLGSVQRDELEATANPVKCLGFGAISDGPFAPRRRIARFAPTPGLDNVIADAEPPAARGAVPGRASPHALADRWSTGDAAREIAPALRERGELVIVRPAASELVRRIRGSPLAPERPGSSTNVIGLCYADDAPGLDGQLARAFAAIYHRMNTGGRPVIDEIFRIPAP